MLRCVLWTSPVIGVLLGLGFLLVTQYQSPVEANPPASAATTQHEASPAGAEAVRFEPFVWPTLQAPRPGERNAGQEEQPTRVVARDGAQVEQNK